VKLLNSSPSPFDFSSETTSNMASKMLTIELWVGRQFKLEICCSNMYADDDGRTILEQVERI